LAIERNEKGVDTKQNVVVLLVYATQYDGDKRKGQFLAGKKSQEAFEPETAKGNDRL